VTSECFRNENTSLSVKLFLLDSNVEDRLWFCPVSPDVKRQIVCLVGSRSGELGNSRYPRFEGIPHFEGGKSGNRQIIQGESMRKAGHAVFASFLLLSAARVGFAQNTDSNEVRGTGIDSWFGLSHGVGWSKRYCGAAYRKERRRATKCLTTINCRCQNPRTKVQT
jgi:hypothetical protein